MITRIICFIAVLSFANIAFAQQTRGSFKIVSVNDVYLDGKLLQQGDTFPIDRFEDCIFCDANGNDGDNEEYIILKHSLSNRNYRIGSSKGLGQFVQSFSNGSSHLNFGDAIGRWIDDGRRIRLDRSTIGALNPSGTISVPDTVATPTGPSS